MKTYPKATAQWTLTLLASLEGGNIVLGEPVGDEQAKLEGRFKSVISLESLRNHERLKSSPREFH